MKSKNLMLIFLATLSLSAGCASKDKSVAKEEKVAEETVAPTPAPKELVIERVFNASPEKVWKAWTDPKKIKRWWGPKNYTSPVVKNDLRVGGKYHYAMKGPDGKMIWSTGTYKEVEAPNKLVSTDSFADEKGNVVSPATYGMPADMPSEMIVTVTFEKMDKKKTKMTMRQAGIAETKTADMAKMGWNESFDKLAKTLK